MLAEVGLISSGKNKTAIGYPLDKPKYIMRGFTHLKKYYISSLFESCSSQGYLPVMSEVQPVFTPRKKHTDIQEKKQNSDCREKCIIQFSQMRAIFHQIKKLRSNKLLIKQSSGIRISGKIPACVIGMLLYSCIELPTRLVGGENAEMQREWGRRGGGEKRCRERDE